MNTTKSLVAAFSIASLTLVACGSHVEPEAALGSTDGEQMSSQGLALTVQTGDRVEGSFSRRDLTLTFELSAVEGGRMARIFDAAGQPLVESTFKDGVEDTTLLGGEARVSGAVTALEPTLDGDPSVFEHLSAQPASALIPELKEALRVAGVDSTFFSATPAASSPDVSAQQWLDVWGNWHLSCSEFHDFPTWTFWGWTTFELRPERSSASASLRVLTPWANPTEYAFGFTSTILLRRQYAGYAGRVSNVNVKVNGSCSTPLLAKAY